MVYTTVRGSETRTAILDAISELTKEGERPPSYREIATAAGISMGGLTWQLDRLEVAGIIKRRSGSRGLIVVQNPTHPLPSDEAAS